MGSGIYTENCQCSIVSLGKISIKTRPISSETKDVKNYQKNKSQRSIGENIAENILNVLQGDLSLLQEKAYDKFDMRLENIQILVALPNENWRQELDQKKSPLFFANTNNNFGFFENLYDNRRSQYGQIYY